MSNELELIRQIQNLERRLSLMESKEYLQSEAVHSHTDLTHAGGGFVIGNTGDTPVDNVLTVDDDVRLAGGLMVGSKTTNPGTNNIQYEGNLVADRAANHVGYIYVPLQEQETLESNSSSGSGNDQAISTPSGGSIPAEAKALTIRIFVSGAGAGSWVAFGPDNDVAGRTHVVCYSVGASFIGVGGILNINSDVQRRVYRSRAISGGTLTWVAMIHGYWI